MKTAPTYKWSELLPKALDEVKIRLQIREIFESQTNQADAIIEIYKLMIPDWQAVKKVHGWPQVGMGLWSFICDGFIKFDRLHHPKVFAGGMWMNHGFSFNGNLQPYEISFENCTIEY